MRCMEILLRNSCAIEAVEETKPTNNLPKTIFLLEKFVGRKRFHVSCIYRRVKKKTVNYSWCAAVFLSIHLLGAELWLNKCVSTATLFEHITIILANFLGSGIIISIRKWFAFSFNCRWFTFSLPKFINKTDSIPMFIRWIKYFV